MELMTKGLNMEVNPNHTIVQLKMRALNKAMDVTPGHYLDHVGFGKYAEMTYQDVAVEDPAYITWAVTTAKEDQTCCRLRRFAAWAETSECARMQELGKLRPAGSKSKNAKSSKKGSASSKETAENPGVVNKLIEQVQALSEEVKEMKSQKSRKKNSDVDEVSSSDWDKMSMSQQRRPHQFPRPSGQSKMSWDRKVV